MGEDRDSREVSVGGDPVCWLEHVCPDCGALLETELPAVCWRCGAEVFPS